MVTDLQQGAHGEAARWIPMLVALVNGSAPLIISLIIMFPLLLSQAGIILFITPLYASIVIALMLIFMLGVFLGRISEISWFRSGVQTLLIALFTVLLIFLIVRG
jgi:VIT1/CCC1 family predicted Fe2+/Mn2+ transporter